MVQVVKEIPLVVPQTLMEETVELQLLVMLLVAVEELEEAHKEQVEEEELGLYLVLAETVVLLLLMEILVMVAQVVGSTVEPLMNQLEEVLVQLEQMALAEMLLRLVVWHMVMIN